MDKRKRFLAIAKLILLVLIIAGLPVFVYFKLGPEVFSGDVASKLEEYLSMHRAGAVWTLMLLQAVQVIICILPGQPIQFVSSYMFGIPAGFLIAITGAVAGTFISFCLAHFLGRDFLELLFDSEKIDYFHQKLNSGRGLMAVLLIYLIPGIPKDLVSYVAGISGMRIRPFLIVSSVGRSPAMLGSLLFGYFFRKRAYAAIAALAAVSALILIILFFKRKSVLALLDALETEDEGRDADNNTTGSGDN